MSVSPPYMIDHGLDRDSAIDAGLEQLRRQIQRMALVRGAGQVVSLFAIISGTFLAADFLFNIPPIVRVGLLVTLLVATTCGFCWFVVRPLVRRWSQPELAALIESQHPELEERLISTVEFREAQDLPGSSLMKEMVIQQTSRAVKRLDWSHDVPLRAAKRAGLAALVAMAVLLAPALWRSDYGLLWSRLLVPTGNYSSAGNLTLTIDPGDRIVARGSDVEIRIVPGWRVHKDQAPENIWLHWTDEAGLHENRRVSFQRNAGNYVTTLPHVFQSFECYASEGSVQSEKIKITVGEAPAIVSIHGTLQPPAYTGLPVRKVESYVGDLHAPERSVISLKVEFNMAVDQASLTWPKHPATDVTGDGESRVEDDVVWTLAPDRKSATIAGTCRSTGSVSIDLASTLGLKNAGDPERRIVVDRDQPPSVAWGQHQESRRAHPEDIVALPVSIRDDYGLVRVELHVVTSTGKKEVVEVPARDLSDLALTHEFRVDLNSYALSSGQSLTCRVRAVDNRDIPGPQETWSSPQLITIDSSAAAPHEDRLVQMQQSIEKRLEELKMALQEHQEDLKEAHQDAAQASVKNRELEQHARLEKLAQREQKLAEDLEKLAQQIQQQKLYGDVARALEQAAKDDLAKAREHLEGTAELTPRDRLKPLSQALDEVQQAVNKVSQISQEFAELARIQKELAELVRLANRADRLADKIQPKNPSEVDPLEPQPAQEMTAAEKAELEKETAALAEELQKAMQSQPELMKGARQMTQKELGDLATQGKELAEAHQRLADALEKQARDEDRQAAKEAAEKSKAEANAKKEADKQAAAARAEAIKKQQELRNEAQKLSQQVSEADGKESEAAKEANQLLEAAKQALAALEKGDLAKAAEQAREAAKEAGEAGQSIKSDAGKPLAERAKEISQQQSDLADRLEQMNAASKPGEKSGMDPAEANQSKGQQSSPAEQQRQIAEEAEALAQSARKSRGETPDAEQAQKFAETARQAANRAQEPGESRQAAQQAEQAAKEAEQARQSMKNAQPDSAEAKAAEELASRQQQVANQLKDQARREEAAEAVREQAELAADAREHAEEVAEMEGKDSAAAKQARDFAKRADDASKNAMAGELPVAARQANEAAKSTETPNAQPGLKELGEREQQISEKLNAMKDDPQSQKGARAEGQKILEEATAELAAGLKENAETMKSLQSPMSDQAQAAAKSADQASESAQKAGDQLDDKQSRQAGQSSREASNELRKSAEAAKKAAQDSSESKMAESLAESIGESVAQDLNQAMKELAEAQNRLRQSNEQAQGDEKGADGAPRPSSEPSSSEKNEGKGQESSTGSDQKTPKSPGSSGKSEEPGQPSGEQSSPSSESNKAAADALRRAAKDIRQASGEPGSPKDMPPQQAEGATGQGTTAGDQGGNPPALSGNHDNRKWGTLPSDLRTEISQGSSKKPHGDYSKQIKNYFNEISKPADPNRTQPASPASSEAKPSQPKDSKPASGDSKAESKK